VAAAAALHPTVARRGAHLLQAADRPATSLRVGRRCLLAQAAPFRRPRPQRPRPGRTPARAAETAGLHFCALGGRAVVEPFYFLLPLAAFSASLCAQSAAG